MSRTLRAAAARAPITPFRAAVSSGPSYSGGGGGGGGWGGSSYGADDQDDSDIDYGAYFAAIDGDGDQLGDAWDTFVDIAKGAAGGALTTGAGLLTQAQRNQQAAAAAAAAARPPAAGMSLGVKVAIGVAVGAPLIYLLTRRHAGPAAA